MNVNKWIMASALLALAGTPAFANGLGGEQSQAQVQGQQQAQANNQKQYTSQFTKSIAASLSQSKATGGNASAKGGSAGAQSGASSDNSVSQEGDKSDVNAWGFSYVDSAPQVPQAAIADQVVVTSQNLKILGPIFGYAWQSTNLTPAGLFSMVELTQMASTHTAGDTESESVQASALSVLCTYKPELADARFGDHACDRIGEIVASAH